ncbi:MAG: type II toxin-antitoxin system Phd/YefM family antitoxin [Caldilineaceae bacterium]
MQPNRTIWMVQPIPYKSGRRRCPKRGDHAEAQNRLSKLIDAALAHGPQIITRHGSAVAVVLAYDEYRMLTASKQKMSEFFRQSLLAEAEIDLTRDKSENCI